MCGMHYRDSVYHLTAYTLYELDSLTLYTQQFLVIIGNSLCFERGRMGVLEVYYNSAG